LDAAIADAQISKVDGGESGTDSWASEHKPDFDRKLLSESSTMSAHYLTFITLG